MENRIAVYISENTNKTAINISKAFLGCEAMLALMVADIGVLYYKMRV